MDHGSLVEVDQASEDLAKDRPPPLLAHLNALLVGSLPELGEVASEIRLANQVVEGVVLKDLVRLRHMPVVQLLQEHVFSDELVEIASVGVLLVIELHAESVGSIGQQARVAPQEAGPARARGLGGAEVHDALASTTQLLDDIVPCTVQRLLRHGHRDLLAPDLGAPLLQTLPVHFHALLPPQPPPALEVEALEELLEVLEEPGREAQLGRQGRGHLMGLRHAQHHLPVEVRGRARVSPEQLLDLPPELLGVLQALV
mmetsp:Transcript_120723/g.313442  ORF Transcript_120723/g.313442 Transcript_120723/m.313442 type:complete len:257 (-) Transcript_120723:67-837(-)